MNAIQFNCFRLKKKKRIILLKNIHLFIHFIINEIKINECDLHATQFMMIKYLVINDNLSSWIKKNGFRILKNNKIPNNKIPNNKISNNKT